MPNLTPEEIEIQKDNKIDNIIWDIVYCFDLIKYYNEDIEKNRDKIIKLREEIIESKRLLKELL